MDNLLYKLIEINDLKLKINERLPKFQIISQLLKHHHIPYESWYAESSLQRVEMSFSINCNFKDVYLLAYLFRDYGVSRIYPSRNSNPEIMIGTYIYQYRDKSEYALARSITIEEFLKADPKTKSSDTIGVLFTDCFYEDIISQPQDFIEEEEYKYLDLPELDEDERRESYSQYTGSYAQEVENLSDDFINDLLDGDPDAYWNID